MFCLAHHVLGITSHSVPLQVLELSNARKALSALLEEDADGYTITAAIEHARRVGVDSEVCILDVAPQAQPIASDLSHGKFGLHFVNFCHRFSLLHLSSLRSARKSGCCCRT
jgi:hypothetical protein